MGAGVAVNNPKTDYTKTPPSWPEVRTCIQQARIDSNNVRRSHCDERRVANSSEQGLLSCGRTISRAMEGTATNSATQRHSLRKDIVNLTQEDDSETGRVMSARFKTSYPGYSPNQEDERDTHTDAGLPPPRPSASGRGASPGEIRRVDLVGQSVTSLGLADVVEAALGAIPTTHAPPSRHFDDTRERKNMDDPLLWSLTFRQCQLESLLPVAGLLNHLDGLIGLGIHGIDRLALAGVERVLADARCLCTLTIRHCRLVRLPRLQSGSIEVLDLSNNAIESAAGLETLFRLKELNLAGNRIRTLLGLRPLVPLGTGCLRELNLKSNPVQNTPRSVRLTPPKRMCPTSN